MYEQFYLSNIKDATASGSGQNRRVSGKCPFHDDGTASFSVFVGSGVWACFGACQLKAKSPVEFVSRLKKVSLNEAAELLAHEGIRDGGVQREASSPVDPPDEPKFVPGDLVDAKHAALLENSALLTEVTALRLWSLDAIRQFKIGWDAKDDRIWFPVPGEGGWVDVRRYDWRHKSKTKFLPFNTGYGKPRPWPSAPTPDEEILLLEGEPDCLLARSLGLNAYTSTGGAGSPVRMACARATLLFDLDDAGVSGAEKAAATLRAGGVATRTVLLPGPNDIPIKGFDFTDVVRGGQLEELKRRIIESWAPTDLPEVSLAKAIDERFFGQTLKVHAVASGKVLTPYQVTKTGVVVCSQGLPLCKRCGIVDSGGHHSFEIKQDSPKTIELADEPSPRVRAILKEHLGIPKNCTSHEIETSSVQNLFNIRLTSEVELNGGTERSPYIAIQAWSTKDVELNTPFILTARAMPDPKTQAGTLLINSVESGKTSIDDFRLSPEQMGALEVFKP